MFETDVLRMMTKIIRIVSTFDVQVSLRVRHSGFCIHLPKASTGSVGTWVLNDVIS